MLNSLFDSTTVPLLQKVASFAERRHEVLAGNIANISTPDYKTRDLPVAAFQAALQDAVARRQPAANPAGRDWSFTTAQSAPLSKLFPTELFEATELSPGSVTFQDGNNRSVEREVMEMTKNSLLQNIAIELMNAQMNRLQAAISERA